MEPADASLYRPRGDRAPIATDLERVRTLSRVLDSYFLDPLLGLVLPGAGDLIGSAIGLYLVVIAARRRVPPVVIARMLLNLAVDAGLGLVPVIGDLFDVVFKANAKNLRLLDAQIEHPGEATARDWLTVIAAGLAFAAVIGLTIYAIVAVIRAVF
jgi:hypothetical protein